jgi:hypothetical protein
MRCGSRRRGLGAGLAGALLAAGAVVAVTAGACIGGGSVASPQGRSCTRSDCESGVTYATGLQLGALDPAVLEITVCRNAVCATTRLAQKEAALWQAMLIGPLSGRIDLSGAADPRQLRVSLTATATALSDGDVYLVRVRVPGQAPLVETSRPVTYEIVRPDGGDCDAGCAQAIL